MSISAYLKSLFTKWRHDWNVEAAAFNVLDDNVCWETLVHDITISAQLIHGLDKGCHCNSDLYGSCCWQCFAKMLSFGGIKLLFVFDVDCLPQFLCLTCRNHVYCWSCLAKSQAPIWSFQGDWVDISSNLFHSLHAWFCHLRACSQGRCYVCGERGLHTQYQSMMTSFGSRMVWWTSRVETSTWNGNYTTPSWRILIELRHSKSNCSMTDLAMRQEARCDAKIWQKQQQNSDPGPCISGKQSMIQYATICMSGCCRISWRHQADRATRCFKKMLHRFQQWRSVSASLPGITLSWEQIQWSKGWGSRI